MAETGWRGVGGVYKTAYREAGSKDKNFSCHLQTWVRICSGGEEEECFHVCRNPLHLQTDRSLFWMQMTALRLQQRWHRILTGSDLLTRGRKTKRDHPLSAQLSCLPESTVLCIHPKDRVLINSSRINPD